MPQEPFTPLRRITRHGDGKADVIANAPGFTATLTVALSTGNGFGAAEVRGRGHCSTSSAPCAFADVDNDRRADPVHFSQVGRVNVDLSNMRQAGE
jgi:hypothetical protein